MAITRNTTGVYLPEAVSNEIWQDTQNASLIQRLARRINLPGSGISIPVITGDAEAGWVNETANKPVSEATLDQKVLTPYKLAVIELFSDEFRRDLPSLYQALQSRLPGALAKKFDSTVLHGAAPGSGFDDLAAATAIDISTNAYAGMVDAVRQVSAAGGDLSAFGLNGAGEADLLDVVDSTGRPLFIGNVNDSGAIGSILGRPVYKSAAVGQTGTPNTIGVGGDWTSAVWGQVGPIRVDVADQYGGGVDLFTTNQFAVRVEVELGFAVKNADRFVRLTDGATV